MCILRKENDLSFHIQKIENKLKLIQISKRNKNHKNRNKWKPPTEKIQRMKPKLFL